MVKLHELYDQIVSIDYQNEFGWKNGPQDILKSKIEEVHEEAIKCFDSLFMMHGMVQQEEENKNKFEIKDKREEDPLNICCRNMHNYEYHADWQDCDDL